MERRVLVEGGGSGLRGRPPAPVEPLCVLVGGCEGVWEAAGAGAGGRAGPPNAAIAPRLSFS